MSFGQSRSNNYDLARMTNRPLLKRILPVPAAAAAAESTIAFKIYHHAAPKASQYPLLANNYSTLYNFPPVPAKKNVIAVISLGGGLYGSVAASGILTGGDVHTYWTSIGIPTGSHATVVVVPINGAKNTANVNDGGSTQENSLDVEMIGACCPGSIILFYLAPCTVAGFYNAFASAINTPVLVNGARVSPSAISCSWGAPEDNFTAAQLTQYNNLFATAVAKGINICTASGDGGSSDGKPGIHVDFPGSSPNVISCGGTTLTLKTSIAAGTPLTYSAVASETTWGYTSSGSLIGSGGGISAFFASPSYQAGLGFVRRAIPDIAMNADPNTGVAFLVGGKTYQFGGTSVVAPAMAAFVICSGVTGFLNPHIYANYKNAAVYSACFHDITAGSNGAYAAKKGYDTCTGLGSLIGGQIKAHL